MIRTIFLLTLSFLFFQCGNPKVKVDDQGKSAETESIKSLPSQNNTKTFKLEKKSPQLSLEKSAKEPTILGYFAYAADAAVFYPCGQKQAIPVMMEGDYLKMEQEYTRFEKLEFAEKIYVKVIGEYKIAEGMEGGRKKHLVVSEFLGFERGKKCK